MSLTPLLLDYDGAAELLGFESASWLRHHIAELPHVRFGKHVVRFSAENVAEIIRMHTVRPGGITETPTPVEAPPQALPAALLDLKPGRAPRARRKPAAATA